MHERIEAFVSLEWTKTILFMTSPSCCLYIIYVCIKVLFLKDGEAKVTIIIADKCIFVVIAYIILTSPARVLPDGQWRKD